MAKSNSTRNAKKTSRSKRANTTSKPESASRDRDRPMLIVRDWDNPVYLLPFVKRIENPEKPNGACIKWWSVDRGAFDYYHQAEEVGRIFFEEAGRQYLKHGERIEQAVCFALHQMAPAEANWGVGTGFLSTLAHYAMIGFKSLHQDVGREVPHG